MVNTTLLIYSAILFLAGGVIGYLLHSFLKREAPAAEVEPQQSGAAEEHPTPGLLRSWQDADTHQVIVELEGRRLTKDSDLLIDQQTRLAMLAATLQSWVHLREEPAPQPPPPAPPMEASSPRRGPVEAFTQALQADVRLPPQPTNLVAQINDVLQKNIHGTPLADRAIRLMDIPGRGMVIFLGLDSYDEIDSVPDLAIREAIHAAVAEWERASQSNA